MNLWAKTHATFYEKMTSRNCLYCLYCHHQIVATIIVSILKLSHDNCRDNLMSTTEDEEVRMHRYVLLLGAPSSLEMFGMAGPASKQKMVCTFLLRVYLKLLVGLVDRLQCG